MNAEVPHLHIPSSIESIPTGWHWKALRDICRGVHDCPHTTPALTMTGPLVARSQDIRFGVFRGEEAAHVSEKTYLERIARAEPKHGDLLYSREGTYFGIAAEVPADAKVCLGQRMMLIQPDPAEIHFRFLRYWLNSPILSQHIYGFRDGSVAERLNLPTVRGLPIVIPSRGEQLAIAAILGSLDDKIELNRRMNETLKATTRSLFKSWFIDFDFVQGPVERGARGPSGEIVDLAPNSLEQSEVGAVPSGWEVCTLGAVADIIDCLHSKKPERRKEGLPFLQLANIRNDGLLDMHDTYLVDEADYRMWVSRMEASPGDCVITNVGRVGAVAQIPADQRAALGRNMTGVRCKPSFQFPTFLIECLLSQAMRDEIALKMDSGTILDALNVRNIPKLRFVRAPDKLIQFFERTARPLKSQMELRLKESQTLSDLRDTLLPKLMSGELRIKDAERFVGKIA